MRFENCIRLYLMYIYEDDGPKYAQHKINEQGKDKMILRKSWLLKYSRDGVSDRLIFRGRR